MGRRFFVFLAAMFATGLAGHAQDDPGALRGVYGPSQAFPAPVGGKGGQASEALPGVHAPGEIVSGTPVTPPSAAIGRVPSVAVTVAPGLAGVYPPGQAARAPVATEVPANEANEDDVGLGPAFSVGPSPGYSARGPFPVGQALPLTIVPAQLPDQPRNGVAVVNGHRLILERGTNRVIQDLD